MLFWKNLRIPFLALTSSAVFLVLGKSILYPAPAIPSVTPFTFPDSIPLSGWQPVGTQPLTEHIGKNPKYLAGQRYQYTQGDLKLDIEMHYITDIWGDIQESIKIDKSPRPLIRQQSNIGFYTVFTQEDKAYLRSCINAQGPTTVTNAQFTENRYRYDIKSPRPLLWLVGLKTLKDERCLWTHLSIPLKGSSPELAYQKLESAWFPWYEWWQPRFPRP